MFDTELVQPVAALARVAGFPLILHNAHGGREQIMHVREGSRFEPYDGGYFAVETGGAAVAALKGQTNRSAPAAELGYTASAHRA